MSMTPTEQRRAAAVAELQQLYDQLPTVACRGLCADTCTVIDMSPLERDRLRQRGVDPGPPIRHRMHLQLIAAGKHQRCGGLSPLGTCSVYDVRPLICRIYGAGRGLLACEHGCVPEREITEREAYALIERAAEISRRVELNDGTDRR